MKPDPIISIGGRNFRHAGETTLLHDLWVIRKLEECGLDDVKMQFGEKPEAFAHRLLMQAANDGHVLELLGGLLLPADAAPGAWTPEMAAETGRLCGGVTSKEDKATVRGEIAEALASFFGSGLAALKVSPSSIARAQAKPELLPSDAEALTTAAGLS